MKWETPTETCKALTITKDSDLSHPIESGISFRIPVVQYESEVCVPIKDVRLMTEEEWIAGRGDGLGGSDVGNILFPDQYGTPFTVAAKKRNLYELGEISSPALTRGKRLEDCVIVWFQEDFLQRTGLHINVMKSPFIYQNQKRKYQLMNIDGLYWVDEYQIDENQTVQGLGLLEVKTASIMVKKKWMDDESPIEDIHGNLPDKYYAQIQYYLDGLGLEWCILPVWFDGDIQWRVIRVNREFLDKIMYPRVDKYWEDLQSGNISDDIMGYAIEEKTMLKIAPESRSEVVRDDTFSDKIMEYRLLKNELRDLERDVENKIREEVESIEECKQKISAIQTQLKFRMNDAEKMIVGGDLVTWKRRKGKPYTVSGKITESFSIE